jgi:hypothetical protein
VVLLTVGNDGHVTDVGRVVHETTDLGALLALRLLRLVRLLDVSREYRRLVRGMCARDVPPRW